MVVTTNSINIFKFGKIKNIIFLCTGEVVYWALSIAKICKRVKMIKSLILPNIIRTHLTQSYVEHDRVNYLTIQFV